MTETLLLEQNFPNPFNPETCISFTNKEQNEVSLKIYNIKGQLVTTLVNQVLSPGKYSIRWKGRDRNGNNVSSGVYFYTLQSKGKTLTRKMLLIK